MPQFCFHGNSNCQRELTNKITHNGHVSHFVYPPCVSENFDFQGFWPLRIMLLWTCNKKSVQLSTSCSLGFKFRCRVVESHDHSMVSELRSNRQVFYNNVSICISSSIGTQVLPHFWQHLFLFPGLNCSHPAEHEWRLSTVPICTSPVTGNGGHPFVCSLTICTTSLEKCLIWLLSI